MPKKKSKFEYVITFVDIRDQIHVRTYFKHCTAKTVMNTLKLTGLPAKIEKNERKS